GLYLPPRPTLLARPAPKPSPQPHPLILDRLLTKGSDPSNHVQRKLTQDLLDKVTLQVAMGLHHSEFIR
ncbi:MAG: hypothetical protein M3Z35_11875, partial [Nitrospirota bacterium]|nr:hypothetical protein [Nitrospirota bacterium]